MKLFRFDAAVGREIQAFGSLNVMMSAILHVDQGTHNGAFIGCMHIGPKGVVGYHQATARQLFLVVQGTGWVRGGDEQRVPIATGQAAWWDAGEWHESGSDEGMVAIVIEGEDVDPSAMMKTWDETSQLRK